MKSELNFLPFNLLAPGGLGESERREPIKLSFKNPLSLVSHCLSLTFLNSQNPMVFVSERTTCVSNFFHVLDFFINWWQYIHAHF